MISYVTKAFVDNIRLPIITFEATKFPHIPFNMHKVVPLELQAHTQKFFADHEPKLAPTLYSFYVFTNLSYIPYYNIKVVQGWAGYVLA